MTRSVAYFILSLSVFGLFAFCLCSGLVANKAFLLRRSHSQVLVLGLNIDIETACRLVVLLVEIAPVQAISPV